MTQPRDPELAIESPKIKENENLPLHRLEALIRGITREDTADVRLLKLVQNIGESLL